MKRITPIPLLLLSVMFTACVGVTRVPERTRTPQGPVKRIDFSFLRPGDTTRAEVLEKLKPIDTGLQSDHFFLGRWDTSKWGGWAFVAGGNNAAGGTKRFWHDVNFLAEFDDKLQYCSRGRNNRAIRALVYGAGNLKGLPFLASWRTRPLHKSPTPEWARRKDVE